MHKPVLCVPASGWLPPVCRWQLFTLRLLLNRVPVLPRLLPGCRVDPNNAMVSFADMMRKQIVMPAHMMDDLEHGARNGGRNLFADFSEVAEQLEGE